MTNERELVVVATFKDRVTKAVKNMEVSFKAFARRVGRYLKRVQERIKKLAAGFGKMSIALNQSLSLVGKMGNALRDLGRLVAIPVAAAIEQQRVLSQLDSVLRSTEHAAGLASAEIQAMAKSLAENSNQSDQAILSMQNVLLTFTQVGGAGGIFERTSQIILDMSEALDGNLQSAAIQVGKALNSPRIGVSALAEVGVSFTEEQKELIKTLVESGDLMQAQVLILEELEREFGGSAKAASETFGGALHSLRNDFTELLENIGEFITENEDLRVLIAAIAGEVRSWTEELEDLSGATDAQRVFAEALRKALIVLLEGFQAINVAFAAMAQAIVVIARKIADFTGVLLPANAEQRALAESIMETREQLEKLGDGDFFGGIAKGMGGGGTPTVTREMSELRDKLEQLEAQYEEAGGAAIDFGAGAEQVNIRLDSLADSLRDLDFEAEEHARNTRSLADVYEYFSTILFGVRRELESVSRETSTAGRRLSEQREAINNLLGGFGEATGAMEAWNTQWVRLKERMIGVPYEEQIAMMQDFAEALEQQVQLAEGYQAPEFEEPDLEKMAKGFEALKDAAADAWERVKLFFTVEDRSFMAGVNDSLSNARAELADFRSEGERATDDLLRGTQRGIVDFLAAIRDGTDSLSGSFGQLIDTVRLKLSDLLLEFIANRALQGILDGVASLTGIGGGSPQEENSAAVTANTAALLQLNATLQGGGALSLLGGGGPVDNPQLESLEATVAQGQAQSAGLWESIKNGISGLGSVLWSVGTFLFNGLMTIVSAIGVLVSTGSFSSAFSSIVGFSQGGAVKYLSRGGPPGFAPRGTDTVPAMLTPGEYVLRRSAVQAIGLPALDRLNAARGFSAGGMVPGGGAAAGGPAPDVNITINAVDARGVHELLTSREGKEAITGVIRRGLSTNPNLRRQITNLPR